MKKLIILLLLIPAIAFAGSGTIDSAGSGSITIDSSGEGSVTAEAGGDDACTGCDYGSDSKIYDNGNTKTNELWTAYMYALFIPSGSISNDCVTGAYFYADGAGSSGSTMTCALWSNSSGSPGAIIGAGYTGTSGSLATTGCTEDEAIFATPQEAPTDDAWLVCKASAGGDIGRDASGTGTYKYSSNDGSSWSEWAYKPVMGVLGCAP